jgi:hypothetical protein
MLISWILNHIPLIDLSLFPVTIELSTGKATRF